jgi:DNA-binding NarL/FixJ family response regulator
MPRKSGMECLSEIKINIKLKHLPVIIFSTSFDHDVVNLLYEKGAHYYIRKPGEFSQLKKVILEALILTAEENLRQPERDKFVLQP